MIGDHTLTVAGAGRGRGGRILSVDYRKSMEKTKVRIDASCLDWKPPVFSSAQLRYV